MVKLVIKVLVCMHKTKKAWGSCWGCGGVCGRREGGEPAGADNGARGQADEGNQESKGARVSGAQEEGRES